jgi:hypothetical protein
MVGILPLILSTARQASDRDGSECTTGCCYWTDGGAGISLVSAECVSAGVMLRVAVVRVVSRTGKEVVKVEVVREVVVMVMVMVVMVRVVIVGVVMRVSTTLVVLLLLLLATLLQVEETIHVPPIQPLPFDFHQVAH